MSSLLKLALLVILHQGLATHLASTPQLDLPNIDAMTVDHPSSLAASSLRKRTLETPDLEQSLLDPNKEHAGQPQHHQLPHHIPPDMEALPQGEWASKYHKPRRMPEEKIDLYTGVIAYRTGCELLRRLERQLPERDPAEIESNKHYIVLHKEWWPDHRGDQSLAIASVKTHSWARGDTASNRDANQCPFNYYAIWSLKHSDRSVQDLGIAKSHFVDSQATRVGPFDYDPLKRLLPGLKELVHRSHEQPAFETGHFRNAIVQKILTLPRK